MPNNKYNKQLRAKFAEYIKNTICKPKAWDEEIYGKFPAKAASLRNYFIHFIKTTKNEEKRFFVKEFFAMNGNSTEIEKQVSILKTSSKFRSIENFFTEEKKAPYEITSNFIAQFFDLPITTLAKFEDIQLQKETNEKENKIEKPKRSVQTKMNKKKVKTALVSSFLLLIAGGFLFVFFSYGKMSKKYQSSKDKFNEIEELSFKPKYADNLLVSNAFLVSSTTNSTKQINNTSVKDAISGSSEIKLKFFTNNIYNNKFIYSSNKWNFITDPKGEDMNSTYGEPFRKDIVKLIPADCKYPTIANQDILIRYNILNESNFPVFVDNLKIKITGVFSINKKTMHYNVWMPEITELKHEIKFTDKIETYPIMLSQKLLANETVNFALEVAGTTSCENNIYQFQIFVSCNNGKGERFTVKSDKKYYIGFLNIKP